MTVSVNPISQVQFANTAPVKSTKDKDNKNKSISSKVVLSTLAAAGLATLAVICLKGKGKKNKPSDIKSIASKSPKVKNMTSEEKEKLIKDLQAKTDNPATKDEIRRLIESGEWDNLG